MDILPAKSSEVAERQLQQHLQKQHPFTLFPDKDFAGAVFDALQDFIRQTGFFLEADDVLRLLGEIQMHQFGERITFDQVSDALHGCVLRFLRTIAQIRTARQIGMPVILREVKQARDGVFRFFQPGHGFGDDT